ncbi:MAG: BLUF domain-containing protein [Anaerolineales bacterium]
MISLIYVSAAKKLLSDDELLDILRVSRKNNAQNEISGMLLYKGGNFMQVLEGPEEKVLQLYETIRKDARHKDARIISKEAIKSRQFEGWEMAFHNLDNPAVKNEPGFSEFLEDELTAEIYSRNPLRAYILLLTFRDSMR